MALQECSSAAHVLIQALQKLALLKLALCVIGQPSNFQNTTPQLFVYVSFCSPIKTYKNMYFIMVGYTFGRRKEENREQPHTENSNRL